MATDSSAIGDTCTCVQLQCGHFRMGDWSDGSKEQHQVKRQMYMSSEIIVAGDFECVFYRYQSGC